MNPPEKTPCIGFCSTTYGDDVCRGCYRNFDDVIQWTSLNQETKNSFYQQMSIDADSFLNDKVSIIDQNLFKSLCDQLNLVHLESWSDSYRILRLLQKARLRAIPFEVSGLKNNTPWSWKELYRWVDQKMFSLQLNRFLTKGN